jgi:hypothetical protein
VAKKIHSRSWVRTMGELACAGLVFIIRLPAGVDAAFLEVGQVSLHYDYGHLEFLYESSMPVYRIVNDSATLSSWKIHPWRVIIR